MHTPSLYSIVFIDQFQSSINASFVTASFLTLLTTNWSSAIHTSPLHCAFWAAGSPVFLWCHMRGGHCQCFCIVISYFLTLQRATNYTRDLASGHVCYQPVLLRATTPKKTETSISKVPCKCNMGYIVWAGSTCSQTCTVSLSQVLYEYQDPSPSAIYFA